MMKKSMIATLLLIPFLFVGTAIAQTAGGDDPVIMTVDGENVYKSEFENIFKKNNKENEVTKDALDEYLKLFVNFKLKVRAAEDLGMDTVKKFVDELEGYRRQLRRPYMVDNAKNDELVKEAYERLTKEVRVSHILVKLQLGATPEDTLAAYNKIMKLRSRVLGGEDFAKVAKEASEDPSVKENDGDIGYFSAFQMLYPFETVAYNTPVGEISMPVRTRFGYHIVKVIDTREARGKIKVAHIMVQTKRGKEVVVKEPAEQKIREIYAQLQNGADFAELAVKYSDDRNSAKKGGELPEFGAGRMVEEFEERSFSLAQDGEVSEPFETSFGWHIVKRIKHYPVPAFDEQVDKLKQRVQRDTRSQLSRASFIEKLKKEYGFVEYEKAWKEIIKQADTTLYYGNWTPAKPKKLKRVMYEFNGEEFTQMDFAEVLMADQRDEKQKNVELEVYLRRKFREHTEQMITDYEDSQLEKKYLPFRLLMNEYRDGILLFELTNEKVWNKAVKDTAGLQAFYEENKTDYMWKDRLDATIYTCKNQEIAKRVKYLKKKGKGNGEIIAEINKESALNMEIESVKAQKGDNEITDQFEWKVGTSEVKMINDQAVFIEVREVIPAQPKSLKEAKGNVTADYQDYLEKQWVQSLRDKYEVEVNKDVLYSIK